MNIGKKIRSLRLARGMTQRELAGDEITRNMLSRIENGAAMPSIGSLLYLADRLEVSPAYFFDESEKPQSEVESMLSSLYNDGEFEKCISVGSSLPASDAGGMLALCYLNLAVSSLLSMKGQRELLLLAKENCEQSSDITDTVYNIVMSIFRFTDETFDSDPYEFSSATLPSYRAMAANFYMFLLSNAKFCRDRDELRRNTLFGLHIAAKAEMSAGSYDDAADILKKAKDMITRDTEPMLSYMIHDDLEECCTKTDDYRGAYEAARAKQKITSAG